MKATKKINVSALSRVLGLSWHAAKRWLTVRCARRRCVKNRSTPLHVTQRRKLVLRLAKQVVRDGSVHHPANPSAAAIAQALYDRGVIVHKRTVVRDLKAMGFKSRVRKYVPTHDANVWRKRFMFAKEWKGKCIKRVVWSDESIVSINDSTYARQWVQHPRDLLTREKKRIQNVPHRAVWGAVGVGYKSSLRLLPLKTADGTSFRLNADSYKRLILIPEVPRLLREKRVFQQDGARCHCAQSVLRYLKVKKVDLMERFPPYSPDLSPVEYCWSLLKRGVAERRPRTQEQLDIAAVAAWDAIPQRVIDRVCKHFSKAVARCEQRKGQP